VLPQDLPRGAVRHEAQATQPAARSASEVGAQAVETELRLAPVQPVVHLPLRPQGGLWTQEAGVNQQLYTSHDASCFDGCRAAHPVGSDG